MIIAVCLTVVLTIITAFLLPHESIVTINNMYEAPLTIETAKQFSFTDYLLASMQLIYFGLSYLLVHCLHRKFIPLEGADTRE